MRNLVNDFVSLSIRRIRLARGLRVQDMAERSGIPLGSYSCLETGRYRINLENLFRIINVLGVDISEVWPQRSGEPRPVERVDERFIMMALRDATGRLPRMISLEDILDIVCGVFGVTREELESPSRQRHLAEARTVAVILTREQRHLTLVSLSRLLRRDVSSLAHCLRRLEDRLPRDRQLQATIREARRLLEEGPSRRKGGA